MSDAHDGWKKKPAKNGSSDGSFKTWTNVGEWIEGVYLKCTTEPSKFGGENLILYWHQPKTDERFRTRAPASLKRRVEDGDLVEGQAYRVVMTGVEYSKKGFPVKVFDLLEQEPF